MIKGDFMEETQFEQIYINGILEEIRSITHSILNKFKDIAEQIHPNFDNLDSWKTTNHKKLDESQKLNDDFEDLQKCLNSLKSAIVSFSKAKKPIKNITGANTLINTISGYVISINNEVKNDGFEIDDENDAKVFKEMQNKYFEFIAEMKNFFAIIRKEGFNPPNVTDIYNNVL